MKSKEIIEFNINCFKNPYQNHSAYLTIPVETKWKRQTPILASKVFLKPKYLQFCFVNLGNPQ